MLQPITHCNAGLTLGIVFSVDSLPLASRRALTSALATMPRFLCACPLGKGERKEGRYEERGERHVGR